jgi:hypothetical protein
MPVRYVELPAVPRAGHDFAVQHPLSERAAPVQAGAVDGVEFASYIGHSYGFSFDLKLADGSSGQLVYIDGSHESHISRLVCQELLRLFRIIFRLVR